ncbi:hypothetical protein AOLI_G00186040 [Acnodon oligacanthus]
MKTYLLFLLTIAAVTAAPATPVTSGKQKLQSVILKEIIENVKHLDAILDMTKKKMFVQQVIKPGHCTPQNVCKAGEVLEKLKAEDLGLQEKNWLLPRKLVALTRNIQCKNSASDHDIELHQLLSNIQHCAQEMNTKN